VAWCLLRPRGAILRLRLLIRGELVIETEPFEFVQHPLGFSRIDAADRQPRVNDHKVTDLSFRHAGHMAGASHAAELDRGTGKYRIAIDPLHHPSGNT